MIPKPTRVEKALFERLFVEGGEYFSLEEIKNNLAEFSNAELMRGVNKAVKNGFINESEDKEFGKIYFK